jgi:hypothetical protein
MEQIQNKVASVKPNMIVIAIAVVCLVIVAVAKNMMA